MDGGSIRYIGPGSGGAIEVMAEPLYGQHGIVGRVRVGRRYKGGRMSRRPEAVVSAAAEVVRQLGDLWYGSLLITGEA